MIIYCITNTLTNDIYIGKSHHDTPTRRWKEHIRAAWSNPSTHLHRAIAKYGADAFTIKVHECCRGSTPEMLCEREIFWIKELSPRYNMTEGGDGGKPLYKHIRSNSHKENISNARKGMKWYHDPVSLEEVSIKTEPPVGYVRGRSPKTKHGGRIGNYTKERAAKFQAWKEANPDFRSDGMKGKTHSHETKIRMKAAREGRKWYKTQDGEFRLQKGPVPKEWIKSSSPVDRDPVTGCFVSPSL